MILSKISKIGKVLDNNSLWMDFDKLTSWKSKRCGCQNYRSETKRNFRWKIERCRSFSRNHFLGYLREGTTKASMLYGMLPFAPLDCHKSFLISLGAQKIRLKWVVKVGPASLIALVEVIQCNVWFSGLSLWYLLCLSKEASLENQRWSFKLSGNEDVNTKGWMVLTPGTRCSRQPPIPVTNSKLIFQSIPELTDGQLEYKIEFRSKFSTHSIGDPSYWHPVLKTRTKSSPCTSGLQPT